MILLVDQDQASLAQFHSDLLQSQALHIALPSRSDQSDVELPSRRPFQASSLRGGRWLPTEDIRSFRMNVSADALQLAHEPLHDLGVYEGQDTVPRLDQSHMYARGRQRLTHIRRQSRRRPGPPSTLGCGLIPRIVSESQINVPSNGISRRVERRGAGCDQDQIALDLLLSIRTLHTHGMNVFEAASPRILCNPMLLQLSSNKPSFIPHHNMFAVHELFDRQPPLSE